jgi:hypothetical protein
VIVYSELLTSMLLLTQETVITDLDIQDIVSQMTPTLKEHFDTKKKKSKKRIRNKIRKSTYELLYLKYQKYYSQKDLDKAGTKKVVEENVNLTMSEWALKMVLN